VSRCPRGGGSTPDAGVRRALVRCICTSRGQLAAAVAAAPAAAVEVLFVRAVVAAEANLAVTSKKMSGWLRNLRMGYGLAGKNRFHLPVAVACTRTCRCPCNACASMTSTLRMKIRIFQTSQRLPASCAPSTAARWLYASVRVPCTGSGSKLEESLGACRAT
jgi:hypothetical protein